MPFRRAHCGPARRRRSPKFKLRTTPEPPHWYPARKMRSVPKTRLASAEHALMRSGSGHGTTEHDRIRACRRGAGWSRHRLGSEVGQRQGHRGAVPACAGLRAHRAARAPGHPAALLARQFAGHADRRACRAGHAAGRQRGFLKRSGRASAPAGRPVRRHTGERRRIAGAARCARSARDSGERRGARRDRCHHPVGA